MKAKTVYEFQHGLGGLHELHVYEDFAILIQRFPSGSTVSLLAPNRTRKFKETQQEKLKKLYGAEHFFVGTSARDRIQNFMVKREVEKYIENELFYEFH